MDQRLQYEKLIAGKLQALPIPDMQDEIWSRVKAQLDLDMPTDDGGSDGPAPPQGPAGPRMLGWGLSVVLIALITYFLLPKNENILQEQRAPALPSVPEQSIQAPGERPPPRDKAASPSIAEENSITTNPQNAAAPDSISPAVADMPLAVDSSALQKAPVIVRADPPQADSVPVKKKKGVQVKEEDYRIIPKKDNN